MLHLATYSHAQHLALKAFYSAIGDLVGGLKLVNVRTFAPNGTNTAWSCQARK